MISKDIPLTGSVSRGDGEKKALKLNFPNGEDAAWTLSNRGEKRYSIYGKIYD
jgi:hypothetical protein